MLRPGAVRTPVLAATEVCMPRLNGPVVGKAVESGGPLRLAEPRYGAGFLYWVGGGSPGDVYVWGIIIARFARMAKKLVVIIMSSYPKGGEIGTLVNVSAANDASRFPVVNFPVMA